MKIQVGDKVRFLNEKGEGTVTAIESAKMARVAIEDGFELPYPINQLVIINPSAKASSITTTTGSKAVISSSVPVKAEQRKEEMQQSETEEVYDEGVYLLFEPTNERKLLESPIDIFVVNNTIYTLFFTYSYKYNGEYITMFSGKAEQYESINVDTLLRGNVDQYANIKVDVLFYRNMPYIPLAPVSEIIKIKTVKFYKENTYKKSHLSDKKAYIVNISLVTDEKEEVEKVVLPQLNLPASKKRAYDPDKVSKPHTSNNSLLEREVDLHLEEILEDMQGMTNGQKLEHQLNYFKRCLDQAFADNIRSIVFIHGVGNGRLKTELRKILDTYTGIRYHDASFRSYGFGATEVLIY